MLYQALEETPDILTTEERERLRPKNFFSHSRPLRQEDVLGYESELKRVVGSLMDTAKAEPDEDSPLLAVTKRLTDPHIGRMNNGQLNALPDGKEFLRNLLGLLSDLHVQGDLVSDCFRDDHPSYHFYAILRSPRFFLASTVPHVSGLSTVSLKSSRKPRRTGERRLLNGWRRCARTRPGRRGRNSARNRKNVLGSKSLRKGMVRETPHPRLHGRHHSTLQNLPKILVSLGTTSGFRGKMWIMRSLVLPGGAA